MELWVGALNLGLLYAFMTMGVFITFRIHDFPDITVDGSFTSGAAFTAVLLVSGANPFLALLGAFFIGAVAGCITALIHTRLRINGLLAGILVMTGLYSINLHIMGRSNIPLLDQTTLFSYLDRINPGLHGEVWTLVVLLFLAAIFWLVGSLFFRTDLGISMRVTGNNPAMAAAMGINTDAMKIFGVAISNGLVGISGGLVAQYQGFADIGMGIGTIVIGLAAVIIGESVLRKRSMYAIVLSVILGSIIFRLMIAVALYVGMNPIDLKLLTAIFVLATLVVSKKIGVRGSMGTGLFKHATSSLMNRRVQLALAGALIIIVAAIGYRSYRPALTSSPKSYKIGVLQISDHPLLNITRDSFVKEMARLGYRQGKNCTILLENANGDLPTVNTILDKFLRDKVDVVVPISTACTQAAINKIKDRPVVFATVANPFIIGAGKSDKDHLPNVTGVYGWVPMDRMLAVVRKIIPGKITVGAIWDPAHANSVFNVENLKKAVSLTDDVHFVGATITNSSEVYLAAMSLVNKGINAFVLSPDNIVYSAFESVVKAARPKKIPIFLSDVERLKDGALGALGYDYSVSGTQAARLVDRILKGENPKDIPFERYRKITFGLNLKVAQELGIHLPGDLLAKATQVYGLRQIKSSRKPKIGIVQFAMEPNVELCKKGILKGLANSGYVDGKNIEIIYKNAQANFSMIHSIIQDFIRRKVDIIVPLSTPCVQSAVRLAAGKKGVTVVFTYMFNPYRIGAANTPTDHLPNVTGVSCPPPIEKLLDLIREIFPERTRVGVVWNSSEANSEAILGRIRPYAAKIGLKLIEATVTNPAEVLDASRSLAAKGAQVFLNPGDNTLNVGFDSFAKVARDKGIPVFSVDSELARNAFITLGPDYYQTGVDGGVCIGKVLAGENPAKIPISRTKKTRFIVNMDIARAQGFKVDEKILRRADRIIETQKGPSPEPAVQPKRLALFHFNDNPVIMDAVRGVKETLEKSGILKTHHITIDMKDAQNEFSMAQSVAQDIVRQRYDYIITLSTPALQVMAQVNKKIPQVFGGVTDPYRMGVAKTPREHLPNVTGVATLQPVEATIKAMREIFPRATRIGIVWNPGEACSETCTMKAREAAKKYHFQLLEANVSNTSDVMDAVKSLISRKVDLFFTSGDNTVNMALAPIAALLEKYKIPYFTNNPPDVDLGAFLSMGADFYGVGQRTAQMAMRVINGEDPKDIPIDNFAPAKLNINLKLAKAYGIHVPQQLLDRAQRIVK